MEAKRVTLRYFAQADLLMIVGGLNEQLGAPVCLESGLAPSHHAATHRALTVNVEDVPASGALEAIARAAGIYVWRVQQEPLTVNMIPADVESDPKWTLNRKCPAFELKDAGIRDAVAALSAAAFPEEKDQMLKAGPFGSSISWGEGKYEDQPYVKFLMRRVTLKVKEGTVRSALNQIAHAIGNAWWDYAEDKIGDDVWRVVTVNPLSPTVCGQPDPLLNHP